MKESTREKWADITKGLAIWLMVFCHANLSHKGILDFIYIFHMPVFFLISGYFDKGDPLAAMSFKKAMHSLIRPYFIYSLLGLMICWISPYLHPEIYKDISANVFSIFRAAIIGMFLMEDNVTPFSFMPSGPLWFLIALFFIKLLWMSVILINESRKFIYYFFLGLLIFAVVICQPKFLSLDSAILAFPFYFGGYALKRVKFFELFSMHSRSVFLFVILSNIYLLLWGKLNGHVDIDGFNYGNNWAMFYLNGFIGSFACIGVSFLLQKYDVFVHKIGQVSMTILGLHLYFCLLGKAVAVALLNVDVTSFPVFVSFALACLTCITVVKLKSVSRFSWLP